VTTSSRPNATFGASILGRSPRAPCLLDCP
jgi:hypothetical protein